MSVLNADTATFASLVEGHRRELQVHCYRMLGSLEDSEDLVQETFLRAWRYRSSFREQSRWSLRAWLYRIATNACLDALATKPRRVLPDQLGPARDPALGILAPVDLPWLEPYPDRLLEGLASPEAGPDVAVVERETIELAFLAALQLLPPRQRAVLILRDVLSWSAKETAALLDASVPSVNSLLQRARAALPAARPAADPSAQERAVLRRFMDAFDRVDVDGVVALLREDARATMPPYPHWHDGRDAIGAALRASLPPGSPNHIGRLRMLPAAANLQPSAAGYVLAPGDTQYRAFAFDVLRIVGGVITEITAFGPEVFPALGLPPALSIQEVAS